jgi:hypothetical protein
LVACRDRRSGEAPRSLTEGLLSQGPFVLLVSCPEGLWFSGHVQAERCSTSERQRNGGIAAGAVGVSHVREVEVVAGQLGWVELLRLSDVGGLDGVVGG